MATALFRNRREAGVQLAQRLGEYAGRSDTIVLALPRGGVPVAFIVAEALGLPLDVLIVRKLGTPGHEEFAMGAVASGGLRFVTPEARNMFGVNEQVIEAVAQRELREIERREQVYRAGRPFPELKNQVVLLVDDGLATGATMLAAIAALRQKDLARVVVAVPVAAAETCDKVRREADEMICLHTPEPFYAVSLWYHDFAQTTDKEVIDLLRQAEQWRAGAVKPDRGK